MTTLNGRPKKPVEIKATISEAKEQAKLLRVQAAAAKAGYERDLYEGLWGWWDDFGGSDLWDRLRPSSQDEDGERWVPANIPSDRRHGYNWPIWRTQVELDERRQQSRILCQTNSFAIGLLKNMTNNVIGKGFSYKTKAKGDDPTPEAEATAKKTQTFVDYFLRSNRFNANQIDPRSNMLVAMTREREIFRRENGGDGECFVRLFHQENGCTYIRFIEPEQIREGHGGTAQEGWSVGIRHSMQPVEDVETPEEYAAFWPDPSAKGGGGGKPEDKGSWEMIPAKEIVHLKGLDTASTVKRGISPFQFDTLKALERAAKLQKHASMGAAVRAATAEIWQSTTATQAQAQDLSDAVKVFTRTNGTTGHTENVERIRPGTVRRVGGGQELASPPADQTQSYLSGVSGDLRQANAAFCAPEFWTGDASNGNYSSLESAAAPAVRAGQTDQEYYKIAFGLIVWKAILWAVECGLLPKDTLDVVDLDVEAPAVLHRNELEKAQEDQLGVMNGWKDRQTCASERGLDWDTVQANNQEYQDEQGGGAGGGASPFGLPPEGQPGSGGGLSGPVSESLLESMDAVCLEAGFTGVITDKRGRKIHYLNGKRVAAQSFDPTKEEFGPRTRQQNQRHQKRQGSVYNRKTKQWEQPAKAIEPGGKNLADEVHAAGKEIPNAFNGRPHAEAPEWMPHKVHILDVYDKLKADGKLGGKTLDQFKADLLAAHQRGDIRLARTDLPQATGDPKKVQDSSIKHLTSEFNNVEIPPANSSEPATPPSNIDQATSAFRGHLDAASKKNLDPAALDAAIKGAAKTLSVKDSAKVANDLGIPGRFKSKKDALDHISRRIHGMQNTVERVDVSSATKPASKPKAKRPANPSLPERKAIPIQLPVENKPYPSINSNDRHNAMNSSEHTHKLDPKNLIATQRNVLSDALDRIKGPLREDKPILVIRHNGKDYIEEGHHRAVKAMQTGQKVPARVMTVSADGKLHPIKE
jgi:hypothetical protein